MIRYNVKVNDQIYQVDLERDTTIHDAESTESSADICFEAIKAEYDYCVIRAEKLENKVYILLAACAFVFALLTTQIEKAGKLEVPQSGSELVGIIIYSQRMGIIQTNDYSYRKRNISMAFDRVYTNLKNLRSSKDVMEDEDDTFLETLEKLSLSWNLKESFQELVQKYLEIMKYPNTDDLKIENHFLVISIDEADMNIEHGFEIIEQIRQYLMGPNIIVLLSADYNQLEKICDNHFSREFSAINKFENIDKHIVHIIIQDYTGWNNHMVS